MCVGGGVPGFSSHSTSVEFPWSCKEIIVESSACSPFYPHKLGVLHKGCQAVLSVSAQYETPPQTVIVHILLAAFTNAGPA